MKRSRLSKLSWVSVAAVLGLVVQAVLARLGIEPSEGLVSEIVTAVCGLLVVAGIVAPKSAGDDTLVDYDNDDDDNNSDNDDDNNDDDDNNSDNDDDNNDDATNSSSKNNKDYATNSSSKNKSGEGK